MISKNQIKYILSLHTGKQRRKESKFIAEGVKIIEELLVSDFDIIAIYATQDWIDDNECIYANINQVSDKELQRISLLKTPNKVLALVAYPETLTLNFEANDLILALDRIQDPGNLGTIIRIADWFGISKIVCSKDTVDVYNPKVIQATMGAFSRVKLFYTNLPNWISDLPAQTPIYGTMLTGENMYESNLSDSGIIIMGNEGNGISGEVQQLLTKGIKIPEYGNSQMESLNVAVATSIICAEFRRTK